MKLDKAIVEKILALQIPTVIAVSGFGDSGKSTLANMLGIEIGGPVISVDSFMKDSTIADYSNWEAIDFDRLEHEVLTPFIDGENLIQYGHFDWSKNGIVETIEVPHSGRIIVEGVGLLHPNLLKYFAYTIWVDCSLEEAIARGKRRDSEVYQNPQDERWEGIWKKNDLEYSEAFKPKEMADLVINNC